MTTAPIPILITIACIAMIASGQGSGASQSYTINGVSITIDNRLQRAMVNKHNDLRNAVAKSGLSASNAQPQATYMNSLFYDPSLALLAQNYLNGQSSCSSVGHNTNRVSQFSSFSSKAAFEWNGGGIGENLMWQSSVSGNTWTQAATNAETGWWNEYIWYKFDDEYCAAPTTYPDCIYAKYGGECSCGHYTQMAWADTRYIGCGQRQCSDGLVTLCNYYPAGNVGSDIAKKIYKQPYPKGTPCSGCALMASDRQVCYPYGSSASGLCSGCQATTTTDSCADCCDVCSSYASQGYCPAACENLKSLTTSDYDGVLNGHLCYRCAKSCGTCTTSTITADECSNDGLAYGFEGFYGAFTEDDDPEVIKQTANWAIAGMCIIFGVCCVILGIGYYCHHKKMDSMKLKLKANELMLSDKFRIEDEQRVRAMTETINNEKVEESEEIEVEAVVTNQ